MCFTSDIFFHSLSFNLRIFVYLDEVFTRLRNVHELTYAVSHICFELKFDVVFQIDLKRVFYH